MTSTAPARPPLGWALVAYAAAFGLMNAGSALLVLGVALTRSSTDVARLPEEAENFALSAPGLMAVALVNAAILLSVAFLTARWQGGNVTRTLRLGPTRASPIGAAAAVVGMVGLSFACGSASELLGVRGGGVMERIARALETPTPAAFLFAVAAIGLAPGFAEETFFRGLLQPWLASRWDRWASIVATSVGFGVMHGDPVQGSLTFIAGLFLGWTAERLDGVRPTIAAHAINNSIFVVLSSIGSSEPSSRSVQTAFLAIGTASLAASLAVLRSRRAIKP